jgi:hypothetical protein
MCRMTIAQIEKVGVNALRAHRNFFGIRSISRHRDLLMHYLLNVATASENVAKHRVDLELVALR